MTTQETRQAQVFSGSFRSGNKVSIWGKTGVIRVRTVGQLACLSGRLIVSDPFWTLSDRVPLARRVPIGKYPVQVSIIETEKSAFLHMARIVFSKSKVIRWENAAPQGKTLRELPPGEIYVFGVDSGTASFCDEAVYRQHVLNDNQDSSLAGRKGYLDRFFRSFESFGSHGKKSCKWCDLQVSSGTEGNLIAFMPFGGDGAYGSWFGFDSKGKEVVLLTDFGARTWTDEDVEFEKELAASRKRRAR